MSVVMHSETFSKYCHNPQYHKAMYSVGVNRISQTAVQNSGEVNNRSIEQKKKKNYNSSEHQQQQTHNPIFIPV
jgi:hypothetical protein